MDYLLHHLLQRSAELHPDRTAVEDGERSLTYSELETRSNQMAALLLELGVSKGDRVGLFLDKSIESVVGIYGALKCGAAYVPLDPRAPAARLAYIARDCDLRVVVSSAERATALGGWVAQGAPLETVIVANASVVDRRAIPEGLAIRTALDIDRQDGSVQSVPRDRPGPRLHPVHVRLHGGPEGRHALAPERAHVRQMDDRAVRGFG